MRRRLVIVVALAYLAALTEGVAAQVRAGIVKDQRGPIYGAPVQVEQCHLQPKIAPIARTALTAGIGYVAARSSSVAGYVLGAAAGTAVMSGALESSSTLLITFANEGDVAANLLRVYVQGPSGDIFERDTAILEPGQVVTRRYTVASSTAQPRQVACSIDLAHFTDGSVWSAQGRPQSR